MAAPLNEITPTKPKAEWVYVMGGEPKLHKGLLLTAPKYEYNNSNYLTFAPP